MQVIIPMAGFGKRLRPHTLSRPKPLINVAGKPVLGHVLDSLSELEISELLCITGYLGEQIETYVKKSYEIPARFFEQKELNGQSPAVYLCKDAVSGPALLVFVDTLIQGDLLSLKTETADVVTFVKEVEDPARFGVAELGVDGWVKRLVEKPDTMEHGNLAVVGFYYVREAADLMGAIETQLAQRVRTKGEYYLADAFNIMLDRGARMRAEKVAVWEDCGKPETVLQTNRFLLDQNFGNSEQVKGTNCVVVPPVHIDPGAQLERSVIGPHVTIAAGCKVRDAVVRDSIIEEGARIERILLQSSLIGRDAIVKGSFSSYNVGDSSAVGPTESD
jgi:glucose-1-phosphate thymidylyltransferase